MGRQCTPTNPIVLKKRVTVTRYLISTAKLHSKKYLSVISHTIQKFGHQIRGVDTGVPLKPSYIYIYLFIYIYKEGGIYICAYFLVCNFADFLLLFYPLVSVLRNLDRYLGLNPSPYARYIVFMRVSEHIKSVRHPWIVCEIVYSRTLIFNFSGEIT
jgi:hypothetical protein